MLDKTDITLGEALGNLAIGSRNPSLGEYEKAAPCEQRAILARWREINLQNVLSFGLGKIRAWQLRPESHEQAVEWLAKGRAHVGRDRYDRQIPTGATINGSPELIAAGDLVGE